MQVIMRRGRRRRLARLVSTRETTDRAKNGVPHHQSGSVFTAKREISDESPRFAVQSPVSRGLQSSRSRDARSLCRGLYGSGRESTAWTNQIARWKLDWANPPSQTRSRPRTEGASRKKPPSRTSRLPPARAAFHANARRSESEHSASPTPRRSRGVSRPFSAPRSVRARVASPSASRPPARRASRVSSRSRCRSASSPTTSSSDERRLRHREPRRGRPPPRRDSSATRATRRRPNGAKRLPSSRREDPSGGPHLLLSQSSARNPLSRLP